jgi:hypothetical protein
MKNSKNSNVLSANQFWVDSAKKADNNQMKIKGQTIIFRTTFKVETMEIFQKLLEMKKGRYIFFHENEAKVLTNAFLKIEREQSYGRLMDYYYTYYKPDSEGNIMVRREKD